MQKNDDQLHENLERDVEDRARIHIESVGTYSLQEHTV